MDHKEVALFHDYRWWFKECARNWHMCQTRAHFVEVQLTTVTDRVTILVEPVSPQQISSCLERVALTRTAASTLIALRRICRVERPEGA